MSIPIILYDENHERVGETYHRRAKQLMRSGRGYWLEEGHSMMLTSYLFAGPPTKEEVPTMTESVFNNSGTAHEEPKTPHPTMSNDLLMYIAKQNVAQKKSLIRHIIAYIIAWPVFFSLYNRMFNRSWGVIQSVSTEPIAIENIVEFTNPYTFVLPSPHEFDISNIVDYFNAYRWTNSSWYQPAASSDTYHLWAIIFGAMVAWGIWIAIRGFKIAYSHMRSRTPKPPVDPIALEYQRLMNMSANGIA